MRSRVYLAGPISKGPLKGNIRQGTEAMIRLMKAGYAPFCPQLSAYAGGPTPEALPCGTTHEDWLGMDQPWVLASDALLRLPGTSKGADMEWAWATEAGIPCFTDETDLTKAIPPEQPKQAGHPGFLKVLDEMRETHCRKAADYGTDKDPFANIRASAEFGLESWKGAVLRANDKMTRLKTYFVKGTLANEGVQDSLLDLACYMVIALALLRETATAERCPNCGGTEHVDPLPLTVGRRCVKCCGVKE